MLRLSLLILVGIVSPAFAQQQFGFDNRKPSGQPYLSPEETVKRFTVPAEFEVKLFAGEPDVVNPIAFTIDEKGRVWVVECFEYPKRTPKGKAPRDRIVILEDTDGDGKCDKRTVFAEGKDFPVTEERQKAGLGAFDLASGIEVGYGGVFVGAPPYLWFIENNNDKPGKFTTLLSGFGSQDTHETLNTFQWGPDGWLYGLHGVFTQSTVKPAGGGEGVKMNAAVWRYHPRTKKFEIFAEGTSNPWGMDWRNTDGQFILACCVIPHLYHIVPGGIYKRQAGASYNPYAYGQINEICDHIFHKESGWAHAGLISLDVPHMPERFRNSVIFGSIHGCSIKQNILKPHGSTYIASRGDDFLQSGDKNFRPINLRWGPNGDIYLIDWHDQNPCHQALPDSWDYERGRVYRIQLKGRQGKKAEDLGAKTLEQLQIRETSSDPHTARTVRRLLIERKTPGSISAVPSIQEPFAKEAHALRIFLDEVSPSGDGLKLLEETYRAKGLLKSPLVRRELASAAIRLAHTRNVSPLLHALMQHKEDATDPMIPILTWIAYEKTLAKNLTDHPALLDEELAWLAEQAPDNILVRDQIVARVVRRLVATGTPDALELAVAFVLRLPDTHSREKALDGLVIALDKQTVTPPKSWFAVRAEIERGQDPKLLSLINRLAVSFRDPEAVKRAMAAFENSTIPIEARVEAASQLAALKPKEIEKVFVSAIRSDDAPLSLKIAAARGLAGLTNPQVASDLIDGWKQYPPALRAELVNTLAGQKDSARALLAALAAKRVDRADVTDNVVVRIQGFQDKELNALIEKTWGRTRLTPADLLKLIDKVRSELDATPASFSRGKLVFDQQCAKCHKFEGRGQEVGPNLDGAARDIEYLLGNVLDPNRVIGAPYFQRIVRTIDGRVEQGLLHAEDERSITLKVENGLLKRIPKEDLDGPVQVVEKSLMPEGLGTAMTPQNFRDLVRYLMANPFLTQVTVNGKPVTAGVTGAISLDAKPGEPTIIEAKVMARAPLKTRLLVGTAERFTVFLDGKEIGRGIGVGRRVEPDREAIDLQLTQGEHTLRLSTHVKGPGTLLYWRLLDPNRQLEYPGD